MAAQEQKDQTEQCDESDQQKYPPDVEGTKRCSVLGFNRPRF